MAVLSVANDNKVLRVADVPLAELHNLLQRYGLTLCVLGDGAQIVGSYWGAPEAGIVQTTVYVRADTPVHSLLHETSHVICMTEKRRESLVRDAGGTDLEEAAVCYLQVVLADELPTVGSERLMQDMDNWGYSFRLGDTSRWFDDDASDALDWLQCRRLLHGNGRPTFSLRKH
jgi:hypothetical protein